MPRHWKKLFVAPALLLTFLVSSCDPLDRAGELPSEPEVVTSPQAATVAASDGREYELVEGRMPSHIDDLSVSKLIGPDGGSVSLAGHTVSVPGGAVEEPTLVTMTLVTEGHVEVDLGAAVEITGLLGTSLIDLFDLVDEFERPVTLELTYSWAANVEDPAELRILRMLDHDHDGPHEALDSRVDRNRKVVVAELDHFSRYCMAQ